MFPSEGKIYDETKFHPPHLGSCLYTPTPCGDKWRVGKYGINCGRSDWMLCTLVKPKHLTNTVEA